MSMALKRLHVEACFYLNSGYDTVVVECRIVILLQLVLQWEIDPKHLQDHPNERDAQTKMVILLQLALQSEIDPRHFLFEHCCVRLPILVSIALNLHHNSPN